MDELHFMRKVKSASFATISKGLPEIRIMYVMLKINKLYFITARGKAIFKQLKENPHVAVIVMNDNYKTVRVKGKIEFVGREFVDKIFAANPMLLDLHPDGKSDIVETFCLPSGKEEVFDLSSKPPRYNFTFGNVTKEKVGYEITVKCIECGICKDACPVHAINKGTPYEINQSICLRCGRCFEQCPNNAIEENN